MSTPEWMTDEVVEQAAMATYEEMQRPNWRAPLWDEIDDDGHERFLNAARAALEAVAPLIAAQALRDAAEVKNLERVCPSCGAKAGQRCYGNGEMRRPHSERGLSVSWLRARADRIEAGR